MSNAHLYHAIKALADATNGIIKSEHVEKAGTTIQACSIVAAASGLGASLFPGGALVLTGVAVATVWGMYVKVNSDLGISISENTLKSLASALLSNIITSAGSMLVALVIFGVIGLIPGLHFLSVPAQAVIAYITVFSAGILYIKLLTKLFKAQGSADLSGVDVNKAAEDIVQETDMGSMIKDLKESYKQDKDKIDEAKNNR